MGFYLLHRALREPGAQTNGIALLIDFTGFKFGRLLRHVRLSDMRRGVHMMQECSPAHLNVLYIVNPPKWIETLLGIIRPFLRRDTLQKKLFLLDRAELSNHFASKQLVSQFGGAIAFDWHAQLERWDADETARGLDFDVSGFLQEDNDDSIQLVRGRVA
jgi:hypothetical protein